MNNAQFRRLLVDNPSSLSPVSQNAPPAPSESKTPTLGSRNRSSIPMTPRSVAGYTKSHAASEFAKQVSDAMGPPPPKRFKSSAAPKGTKLSEGYVDRVALRRDGDAKEPVEEDKLQRVRALEEMVASGQMERAAFEKLRAEILGEQARVEKKGLDWKMLRRAKGGEDLTAEVEGGRRANANEEAEKSKTEADLDEELEGALGDERGDTSLDGVQKKEARKKQGTLAKAQGRLARDEILKQFRRDRGNITNQSAVSDPGPSLGYKFKTVKASKTTSRGNKRRWIEVDEKTGRRREVLMTTDKEGNPKRKVRWLDKETSLTDVSGKSSDQHTTANGKKKAAPKSDVLGMEVPAEIAARQKALEEESTNQGEDDDDIFVGVGADYNPLAGAEEDLDSGSSDEESASGQSEHIEATNDTNKALTQPLKPRNYFSTSSKGETISTDNAPTQDATLMAAIKRAAAISKVEERQNDETPTTEAEAAHRKQFLDNLRKRERQDAEDLDMGFGESRFGDEDDEEGPIWEEGEEGKGEKKARKRGPKKKKGDKENLNDVMSVLEGRAGGNKTK